MILADDNLGKAFIVVYAFAAGVLVRDVAQDFIPPQRDIACERHRENAERFARAIAEVLNGRAIRSDTDVAVCRVRPIPKEDA